MGSKINADKSDLESLIYGTQKSTVDEGKPADENIVDNEGGEVEQEPLFPLDYENDMKGFRKKARNVVTTMAKHVLPQEYLSEPYVISKMEQDIDTLSELYWTRKSNNDVKLVIMDSISKGNTAPRMFDVYKSTNDAIADVNKQILATENNLRKTYLDLKYEIQSAKAENETHSACAIEAANNAKQSLPKPSSEPGVYTGTKAINNKMKQYRIEMERRRLEEERGITEDVEFENVDK